MFFEGIEPGVIGALIKAVTKLPSGQINTSRVKFIKKQMPTLNIYLLYISDSQSGPGGPPGVHERLSGGLRRRKKKGGSQVVGPQNKNVS